MLAAVQPIAPLKVCFVCKCAVMRMNCKNVMCYVLRAVKWNVPLSGSGKGATRRQRNGYRCFVVRKILHLRNVQQEFILSSQR